MEMYGIIVQNVNKKSPIEYYFAAIFNRRYSGVITDYISFRLIFTKYPNAAAVKNIIKL